ncbi:amidohydrolase [Desulfomonile tiedjei]|uniref:5-methylthioadenosine/S-adenosylhomocysteine deaminase n=1 Tax=Desulfomonile tiedjei (strain ATCC 49306 / DSM 6799 / DCB-1) TaxID=706587 RepID=I4C8H9_DESTA|nr:amidohydrolase [Desulfomonile tiedjei]AFM25870.1 cytosine deaminase-like metal-dependent hydrolase [Desulfomonile tiedjei DSM 6799]
MTGSVQEIALVNGLILADPRSCKVVPHGKTIIKGNRIAEVNSSYLGDEISGEVLDCTDCIILPGLVNAHTHAAMSLLRGLADDLPLNTWLNDYIFPSEGQYVAPDFVYLGTSLSAVEMALAGITTFADGYFFMERAAEAAAAVGLRAIVAQGILDVPVPDNQRPEAWPDRVRAFFSGFPSNDLVTPALFCHSPYLCSPETLVRAKRMAEDHNCLLFSHIAETRSEVEQIGFRYNRTPLDHVHALGILDPNFVAVHCVHLSEKEVELAAESKTGVVHCPESNMKLASGACPAWDLVRHGAKMAIGTDGPASNNNLDLFEEMRSASFLSKLLTGNPEALDAATALRMATIGGAEALGLDDRIGSLEPGKFADIIVIDLNRPHLMPVFDPVSHLVYSAKGSDVRDVLVNGKFVVRNGTIMTVDTSELYARVRDLSNKIAAALDAPGRR